MKWATALLGLGGCIGATVVRTEVKRGDIIVATSTQNMSYIVDTRTRLCFFVYSGDPSGAVSPPSGIAQVPCEQLKAIPEMREHLEFLPGNPAAP